VEIPDHKETAKPGALFAAERARSEN